MPRCESAFRRSLIQELRKHGAFIVALESGETAIGIPDVYGCSGSPYFIELKVEKGNGPNYKRKIPFRPGQLPFLNKNKKEGGRSFFAIRYDNGILFADIKEVDSTTKKLRTDTVPHSSILWLQALRGRGDAILRWIRAH